MSGRLNIGIIGATGRFGSQIVKAAVERGWSLDFQRSSSTEARTTGRPSVLFECARAEATLQTIETALSFGSTLVLATSGRTAVHDAAVAKAAGHVPVVIATNLSRGHLLHLACARFLHERSPHQMSSTVIDRHPATKRDAPSATAKRLAEAAGGAQIEILRHGNAVADHHVIYTLAGETIEIVHRVTSLEPSVLGALDLIEAASRLTRPGLYDIESPELRVRC